MHETKSGLQYVILKSGDGKTPHKDSVIKMHYTASLADGTKFDSTYDRKSPAEVRVSALFSGWAEGMQLISRGAKAKFFIPPALAYGTGVSQKVPSNSVVVLEVELLDVK
jgi:FKBP-type peptidyl-prolyl cis-trans isomerase FkpA